MKYRSFKAVMLSLVLFNTLALAFYNYTNNESSNNVIVDNINTFSTAVYMLEALGKLLII